jgi:hypothetical protein
MENLARPFSFYFLVQPGELLLAIGRYFPITGVGNIPLMISMIW